MSYTISANEIGPICYVSLLDAKKLILIKTAVTQQSMLHDLFTIEVIGKGKGGWIILSTTVYTDESSRALLSAVLACCFHVTKISCDFHSLTLKQVLGSLVAVQEYRLCFVDFNWAV